MRKIRLAIAVHGGAGSSSADRDGCERAAQSGAALLTEGGSAMDAAVQAVIQLENDGRYNAGYGSLLALEGLQVEMDAAVMDSAGALGAVACLRSARNPILAALAVADTPHWLLAGEGADRFALRRGLEPRKEPSPQALKKRETLIAALRSEASDVSGALEDDWNFPISRESAIRSFGSGTVGAVAVDANGRFAVATSTGGCAPALLGRVGDTPIIGCGFFAGSLGAIAVTGVGEYIVPRLLAHSIYEAFVSSKLMAQAIDAAIVNFPPDVDLGIIGISETEIIMKSNRDMSCAAVER